MTILFLSRWFPYPPDNGSRIRIWNLLRQLSRRHEVSLIAFYDPGQFPGEAALDKLGSVCSSVTPVQYRPYRPTGAKALAGFLSPWPRYLVDTYRPEMQSAVEERLRRHRPSLLVASELSMVPYVLPIAGIPAILEDLELTSFLDAIGPAASPARKWRGRLTWLKLASFLRRALPRFTACTVVSELERGHLARLLPSYSAVHVLPNAVELADYDGKFGTPVPNSLVFTGALTYSANLDALRYLLGEIYPSIIEDVPDIRLRVTGRTDGVDLKSLPSFPDVEITGYVPDIRPVVAQSWTSLVPLRLGGGTRLKILESMALGTPVVATTKGAEGLEATDDVDLLLANHPREFAEKTVGLLRSPVLRARIASSARSLVQAKYSWEVAGRQLNALIDSAGPGSFSSQEAIEARRS